MAAERAVERNGHERLANGLGWFSIGLGVAHVMAPDAVAEMIGLADREHRRKVMRGVGLREIAAGIGILTNERPAGWVWGRVAGDAFDLASLGFSFRSGDADRSKLTAALAALGGVAALDVICAARLSESRGAQAKTDNRGRRITSTVVINKPPEEVYRFWRNFENLPKFIRHLESVKTMGDGQSHWKAKGPMGATVEWHAELVDDQPNARIAWRSLDKADVDHAGSVEFQPAPGGRGTLLRVELEYTPPGGAIGATAAKLFRSEPGQQIEDALRNFKSVMETGEVVNSDASIHRGSHPAQPPERVPAQAASA